MAMAEVTTGKADGNAVLSEIANDVYEAHEMASFFLDIADAIKSGNFSKAGAFAFDALLFEQVNRLERVSQKLREFQHWEQDKPRQIVGLVYRE